jgi:hypothetical protein
MIVKVEAPALWQYSDEDLLAAIKANEQDRRAEYSRTLALLGTGWEVRIAEDHLPGFIPPDWLDSERVPRRNPLHRRG